MYFILYFLYIEMNDVELIVSLFSSIAISAFSLILLHLLLLKLRIILHVFIYIYIYIVD